MTATAQPGPATRPFDGAGLSRVQKNRKRAFAAAAILVAAVCPFLRSYWASETIVHEAIEALGLALMGIAVIGRAWCTLYIGGRKAQEIVRRGPYSVSRNPLYMFSFVAVFGAGMQAGSLVFGGVLALIAFLVHRVVIAREEEVLERRFGAAFDAYRRAVPRFGPRLSAWREAESLAADPALFWRTIGDGALFFLSIPLLEALEYAQIAFAVPVLMIVP